MTAIARRAAIRGYLNCFMVYLVLKPVDTWFS